MAGDEESIWYTSPRELPIYKNWRYKIGRIVDLWSVPCAPTPEVWVSAFFHDVPHLVWALTKPDSLDLVFERFGMRHKKKPKRLFNILDDMAGSIKVPGGGVTTVLFRGAKLAERVGWYMLVADATTEFVINWVSTAYRWDGCNDAAAGWAQSSGNDDFAVFHPFSGDPLPIWTDFHEQFPCNANGAFMQCAAGYDASCGFSLQFRTEAATGFPAGQINAVELVDYETNRVVWSGKPTDVGDGIWITRGFFRDWDLVKPNRKFGVRAQIPYSAWFNFAGSLFTISADKSGGVFSDP